MTDSHARLRRMADTWTSTGDYLMEVAERTAEFSQYDADLLRARADVYYFHVGDLVRYLAGEEA